MVYLPELGRTMVVKTLLFGDIWKRFVALIEVLT